MMATIGEVGLVITGSALSRISLRWLLQPRPLQKIIDSGSLELIVTALAFPDEVNPVLF
jgi:hypothetical protein